MIPQYVWVGVAILLVVIVSQVAPKWGGWLLLMLTMGMVYRAHKNNLI